VPLLTGREILRNSLEPFRALTTDARVIIARWPRLPEANPARLWAAEISTGRKAHVFSLAGLRVDKVTFEPASSRELFARFLETANADPDVIGIIVQQPVPRAIMPLLDGIEARRDLDGVGGGIPCAAAAAAVRLIVEHAFAGLCVAVVGGRGYVGSHVARALHEVGISHIVVEKGDSLGAVQECNAIISATGVPHLLDRPMIGERHRIIVDIGFTPMSRHPLSVAGDVNPTAVPPGTYYTPVPGGIGPMQIAILLDRIARQLVTWQARA
jgi:methylenetetrahydrofolate dehydrogenase (NADP+)/methenyltetrahydrofolate cyclohydrolase